MVLFAPLTHAETREIAKHYLQQVRLVLDRSGKTIQIDDDDSFPSPQIINQTVTGSIFSSSTLPTRRMWWRVRANNASGSPGNWSSVRRFEVKD